MRHIYALLAMYRVIRRTGMRTGAALREKLMALAGAETYQGF